MAVSDSSTPNQRTAIWLPDPYGGQGEVPFIPAEESSAALHLQMSDEARAWRTAAAAADAGATVPTCDPMGLPVARYREIMDELGIESVAEGIDVVVATLPPAVDGQVCGIYFTIDRWCRLHNDVPASDGPVIEAGQEAFVSLLWLPDLTEPDAATEQEIVKAVGHVLRPASTAELMWCRGVGWVQSPFESQSPALLVVIVRGDSGHLSVWALQSEAPKTPLHLSDCDIKARISLLLEDKRRWLRYWRNIRGERATAPELHGVLCRLEREGAWLAPDDERVVQATRDVAALRADSPDAFGALHGEVLSLEPPLAMGATADTLDAVDDARAQRRSDGQDQGGILEG